MKKEIERKARNFCKKMRVQGIIPRTGKLNYLNLASFYKAKDTEMLQEIKNIANYTLDRILIA